ncbi:hypothetical protein JCM10207_009045 [Rhodosporidiobolus poonsookiae]
MKFLAPLAVALLATSASAATCKSTSRRARRAVAIADVEKRAAVHDAPAGRRRAFGKAEKKVVRRDKSGWRMGKHGDGHTANAAPSGGAGSPGKNNWSNNSGSSSSAAGDDDNEATSASSTMTTQRVTQRTSTTSAKATQTSSSSSSSSSTSSSSSGSSYTGEATYYLQQGVAGACGSTHSDSDKVIALQTSMYGSGGYCGKTVTITNTANSKSVTATVADECPSCSTNGIDLSQATFEAIGDLDTGVLTVEYSFLS